MNHHPDTGFHYGVVIPREHGPFTDIRGCYAHAARKFPWLSIITPGQTIDYGDPRLFVCAFVPLDPLPPLQTIRATVALVYSEAMDRDLSRLMPAHLEHWKKSVEDIELHYDGVFTHTPAVAATMAEHLAKVHVPAPVFGVLPVGWEPEVMGWPRGTTPVRELCYHGSLAGRRRLLVPFLSARLGHRFYDASGSFGRALIGALEQSMASLYLAHSSVESFSTWRSWQAMAAGCAFVGEPGDMWPFEAGRDYVPIGPFSLDNADDLAERLAALTTEVDYLSQIARNALAHNAEYTTTRCIERFLVPASVEMARAR